MSSSFPGSLDTFATNYQDDTDAKSGLDLGLTTTIGTHAQAHNDNADAINKIEIAIGPNTASYIFTYVGRQAADLTNSSTATPSATDFSFSIAANGIYLMDLYATVSSAATTTGFGFAVDTSVAVTEVSFIAFHQLANTGTLTGSSSISDLTFTGVSSGVPTATTIVPVYGGGRIVAGASSGTATLNFRTEVNASAVTLKANSVLRVQRIA